MEDVKQKLIFFTLLGLEPTYENFKKFRDVELVPFMEQEFVEEEYHRTLYDNSFNNNHNLTLISRGHGKSEDGIHKTVFVAACQPINKFSGQPIKEQLILTPEDNSKKVLGARIKDYFYKNPALKQLIPSEIKDKGKKNDFWNGDEMYLNNGSIIHFRTITSKAIRGNHVGRLWADDLVAERQSIVDEDLKALWDGAVDGTTTNKKAIVDLTGTPLRHGDLYYHLEQTGEYNILKLPATIEGKPLSKRYTPESLDQIRKRIGSVRFECEYMLNPIDDGTSLIKRDDILKCNRKSLKMINSEEFMRKHKLDEKKPLLRPSWAKAVYIGGDFAFSDRKTADKSAFCIIAEYEKEGKTYYILLDVITRQGLSATKQLNLIEELNEYYKFDLIGLEENSLKAISSDIRQYSLPIKRFWTGTHDEKETSKFKYKDYVTVGKVNLIMRLGIMFENEQLLIPTGDEYSRNIADQILIECTTYAKEGDKLIEIGVHGDIPIGLGYALEVGTRWNKSFFII